MGSATADINLKFDRYLGIGTVEQESGRPEEALKAFKMASQYCTEPTDDRQTLLERLSRAMQDRPLDPNGHAAIALLYESFLRDRYGELYRYADFKAAAEAELRYAIQLSQNHPKEEAQALLKEFENLQAQDCNRPIGHKRELDPYLQAVLLTRNWKNNHEKFEVITRVMLIKLEDGRLFPRIIVPSSEAALDDSIVSACNQSLNEYPMLRWDDEEFDFVCGDKHRSVIRVTHDRDDSSQQPRQYFVGSESPQPKKIDPSLLESLRQRMTLTCLHEYCRDDTQTSSNYWAPNFPPLRNGAWTFPKVSKEKRGWSDLFPDAKGRPWNINCLFLANGKPSIYQLWHFGKTSWELNIDAEDHWTNCDEYFLKRRIRHQLFVSILRYQLAHCLNNQTNEWQMRRPVEGMWQDKVNSYDKDRIVYTCPLREGRIVTARLDKKREIEFIEIDGKVDALWMSALAEFEGDPYQRET